MCLISIAPEGTDKYSAEFRSAVYEGMSTQWDGTGYAYYRKNSDKVIFNKGYILFDNSHKNNQAVFKKMAFATFWEHLESLNLEVDDILVIHHRTGTSGLTNIQNCHPFEIIVEEGTNINDITKSSGETKEGVVFHNGVFSNYTKYDTRLSDTANLVHHLFTGVPENLALVKRNSGEFLELYEHYIGYNKLAILCPNNLITIGTFITTISGYIHSNSGYLESSAWYDRGGEAVNRGSFLPASCSTNNLPEVKKIEESTGRYVKNSSPLLGIDKPAPPLQVVKEENEEEDIDEELNIVSKVHNSTFNAIKALKYNWVFNQIELRKLLTFIDTSLYKEFDLLLIKDMSFSLLKNHVVTLSEPITRTANELISVAKTVDSGTIVSTSYIMVNPDRLLSHSHIIPKPEYLSKYLTYLKLKSCNNVSKNSLKYLIKQANSFAKKPTIFIKKPIEIKDAHLEGIRLFIETCKTPANFYRDGVPVIII